MTTTISEVNAIEGPVINLLAITPDGGIVSARMDETDNPVAKSNRQKNFIRFVESEYGTGTKVIVETD